MQNYNHHYHNDNIILFWTWILVCVFSGSKTIASQSKVSISSRMGGNLKQQSTGSTAGQGGVVGGEVGVPSVLIESNNSVSSKESPHRETGDAQKPTLSQVSTSHSKAQCCTCTVSVLNQCMIVYIKFILTMYECTYHPGLRVQSSIAFKNIHNIVLHYMYMLFFCTPTKKH